jgi:hypothetical protein
VWSCSANSSMQHEHLPCWRSDFGKQANYSAWYCIQQSHMCWNNYPGTFIIQESACQVGPKEVNVWPEGAVCCFVCQTSALVWTGGKHIPRAKSDPRWDVGALLHSNVNAVQHGMESQGISTTQKTQRHICELARSWQVCFGIQKEFLPHGITINA